MATGTEGFGSINWWGFSQALDLLSLSPSSASNELTKQDFINILLVGAGDLRHVMQTLAGGNYHKHGQPLHFYIIESNLEVIARHILFLALFYEPQDKIGTREKTELFLELFGNSLIRAHTAHYVREKSTELIKIVTDQDYLIHHLPLLDITLLKFKERDMLEGIFKFWRNPDEKTFDIRQHWEGRLRHYLTQRYDARSGVFDWDYHMKLQEMVPTINSREYVHWREIGVSFQLRDDAPYENSNRTLANGAIIQSGGGDTSVARRGYWGDIVNSPYIVFGSYCHNEDMLKKVNGKYVKSCQEICEHNIHSLLETLLTGKNIPASSNGTIVEIGEEQEEEVLTGSLLNGSCKVTFLPLNSASNISKKVKFQKFFHYAFFSNNMVHHLPGGVGATFADNCTLVCETARFMLDLKNEHKEEYVKKVTSMANALGFKNPVDVSKDLAIIVFTSC